MRAVVRHPDGRLSEATDVVVDIGPGGVHAGVQSRRASQPVYPLDCYMSARVCSDTWLALFSQPSEGLAPMHAPDLPFPLCLALLPAVDCVCVAFRCVAPAAAYCHWPPGDVLEWLHLGIEQWQNATDQLRRAAHTQPLDAWLASTFDSQWMLPASCHDAPMARDVPPCRDTPAMAPTVSPTTDAVHAADADPCIGIYDILASESVRTDATTSSVGRKPALGRASVRLREAADAAAAFASAALVDDDEDDDLMSDDDGTDEDVGLDEVEEEEEADEDIDDDSEVCEELVPPDVVADEDKDDDEDEEDASSFEGDASSDVSE
jgi:hypothetical protein